MKHIRMKPFPFVFLLFILCITACKKEDDTPQTQTRIVNLQIDSFTTGASVAFQSGFINGEVASVTLGPTINTFTLSKVEFLFGGGVSVARDVTLKVYKDIGTAVPSTLLYTGTYNFIPSNTILQQIDVSSQNIKLTGGGSIRIALIMTDDGLPSVATDQDGTISGSGNWIYTAGDWVSASSLGLTGDFVIRATVVEEI